MIKFEYTEVVGWEHAIRGMRNPMNSWAKSDSRWYCRMDPDDCDSRCDECEDYFSCGGGIYNIGQNDFDLMTRLRNAGTDHRKFMRMIVVYVDITAPLYWWKEFDTYKVGTVANSCSTMHKIHEKEFELSDFSYEHLRVAARNVLQKTIDALNAEREAYIGEGLAGLKGDKQCWYSMIQLLPSSYNQKRTVMLNYEVLANMYNGRVRTPHKLDEWRIYFAKWVEDLPYSEIITGGKGK